MKVTERLSVYFRIPFFKYFIGKDLRYNKLCICYKIFDEAWGKYRWKIL